MRYFKVSLCDAGSRARASRMASSFLSGSESSKGGEESEACRQRRKTTHTHTKKNALSDLGGHTLGSMELLPAEVIEALSP